MEITTAEKNQLPEILELQKLCYRSEAAIIDDFTISPLTQTLEELENEFTEQKFLILKKEKKIIGSVRGYYRGDRCYIGKLIIHPDYQDLGLGKMLLKSMENFFPGIRVFELFTGEKSSKNLYLYQKNGYKQVRTKKISAKLSLIYLEKQNLPELRIPVVNNNKVHTYDDYKNLWNELPKLEIKMIEKNERCQHELGDTFFYKNPYTKPQGVCSALLHVLELYVWRASFGFPSWNTEVPDTYQIHCPDKKGTVWELRQIK